MILRWVDAFERVARLFFIDYFPVAASVAVSCALVFYLSWLWNCLAGRVLITFPVRVLVGITRMWLGVPQARRRIANGAFGGGAAQPMAWSVNRFQGWLERRLARLRHGRRLITSVLFSPVRLAEELVRLDSGSIRLLESDRSILEAVCDDERLSERGILNIIASPRIAAAVLESEEVGAVAAILRFGGVSARRLALFNLPRIIQTPEQVIRLRELADQASGPTREEVDDAIRELERAWAGLAASDSGREFSDDR